MILGNVMELYKFVYWFENADNGPQTVIFSDFCKYTIEEIKESGKKVGGLELYYEILVDPNWLGSDEREHKIDFVNGDANAHIDKLEYYLNFLNDPDYTIQDKIYATLGLDLNYDFNQETFQYMIDDGQASWDKVVYYPVLESDEGIVDKNLTSYYNAVHWFRDTQFILATFDGNIEIDYYECMPEDFYEPDIDIYQYFITDWEDTDVEYIQKHFPNIIIGWCNELELYILIVDHLGTNWKSVPTVAYTNDMDERDLKKLKENINPGLHWNKED